MVHTGKHLGQILGVAVTCVVALTLAGSSALVLCARFGPGLALSRDAAALLPLGEPHGHSAETSWTGRDLAATKAESVAELRVSPVAADAWLRLAEADADRHAGKLSPEGIEAISHAYDAEPYELGGSTKRRDFVHRHMGELSRDLRFQVEQESKVEAGRILEGQKWPRS